MRFNKIKVGQLYVWSYTKTFSKYFYNKALLKIVKVLRTDGDLILVHDIEDTPCCSFSTIAKCLIREANLKERLTGRIYE